MAKQQFVDCKGVAFSEQHAEALVYCGFQPVRIAAPGELTRMLWVAAAVGPATQAVR